MGSWEEGSGEFGLPRGADEAGPEALAGRLSLPDRACQWKRAPQRSCVALALSQSGAGGGAHSGRAGCFLAPRTPARRISYNGMNTQGPFAWANLLHCNGWPPEYPQYMLTGLALENRNPKAAVQAALGPERAFTRNLFLAHQYAGMVDIEATFTQLGTLRGQGCLVHSNHFVIPGMTRYEGSTAGDLDNSHRRLSRIDLLGERKMVLAKGPPLPERVCLLLI